MAEIVSCPACKRTLQVPESYFGQTVQCPECKHMFKAEPQAASVQATPPPATPSNAGSDYPRAEDRRRRSYDDDSEDDYRERRPIRRGGVPHRGGLILGLGIAALILPCAGVICGPMAWIMANSDLDEMRAGNMDSEGEGLTQAGRILGMVSLPLLLIQACCLFGAIAG